MALENQSLILRKTLESKLEEKDTLLKRTEMAVTAKNELLDAKREIIDILKTKLKTFEQDGTKKVSDNVTSNSKSLATDNNNNDNGDQVKKSLHKGIKECCEFIEIHGTNGAILNGTLQWMSIKRSMLPDETWKSEAVSKLLKEEITDAKESLWRVCGDSIPGKNTKRQGTAKTIAEVNDISSASDTLAEKDCLPMFLSSSGMVKRIPVCEPTTIPCDNSEVIIRLAKLEKSLTSVNKLIGSSKQDRECQCKNQTTVNNDEVLTHIELLPNNFEGGEAPGTNTREISNEQGWRTVPLKSNKNNAKPWRNRLTILKRTGEGETVGSISTDVHLVAYGLRKDVTGIQLTQYLMNKGLDIKSCDLLTKYEGSRSLAYKITIKKSDYEKATATDVWPEGIGVRRYKFFSNKRNDNAGKTSNFTNKNNQFVTENSNGSGYAGKLKSILRTSNELHAIL